MAFANIDNFGIDMNNAPNWADALLMVFEWRLSSGTDVVTELFCSGSVENFLPYQTFSGVALVMAVIS